MMENYEDLFQELLLEKVENRKLTIIKMMLKKEVESLTKMVVDRDASINRLSETISRMVVKAQEKEQELREKERVLSDRYDIIAKQIDKIVVLKGHINKLREVFEYGDNEETNEWVGGCEKRVGYDHDSQGQTPPGYGSTEPTRKTPGSPKQSYDYRKVGL